MVVEDDAFVGGLCGLFEGVIIRRRAVLAPGVILLYKRNVATAQELSNAGYRMLNAEELINDPSIDLLDGGKYAILLDSAELSRARGGPRCMTMPLSRRTPGRS